MVFCKKCNKEYPSQDGYFQEYKRGLFRSVCKVCRCLEVKEYRCKNRDAINLKDRQARALGLDVAINRLNQRRAHRKANKDFLSKKWAEYNAIPAVKQRAIELAKIRKADPAWRISRNKYLVLYRKSNQRYLECSRKSDATRRLTFPEKHRIKNANRRARQAGSSGKYSGCDVINILISQKFKCYWCGKDISDGKHTVDHYIPLTKGGANDPANLVAACGYCNSSKGAKLPDEFLQFRKQIFN